MANGTINIGVYNDDRATFDQGVAVWRASVPVNMYLKSDGAAPIVPPEFRNTDGTWKSGGLATEWHNQKEFGTDRVSGITAETCRDLSHTQFSLASTVYGAETGRIQGLDLYAEQEARIMTSYEFVAKYANLHPADGHSATVAVDSWLCGGTMIVQDDPTWEVGYNHYVNRLGLAMPETAVIAARVRTAVTPYTNLQMSWETLTHGFGVLP